MEKVWQWDTVSLDTVGWDVPVSSLRDAIRIGWVEEKEKIRALAMLADVFVMVRIAEGD